MNVSHKILLKNLLIEGHYTQVDYKQERSEMDVEKTQSIAGACREENTAKNNAKRMEVVLNSLLCYIGHEGNLTTLYLRRKLHRKSEKVQLLTVGNCADRAVPRSCMQYDWLSRGDRVYTMKC